MSSVREWPANTIRQLMESHPALFAGRQFEVPGPYLASGWYSIADRLCEDVEELLGINAERFRPTQAKHKWGSWRLYWELVLANDEREDARTSPFNWDVVGSLPPDFTAGEEVANTRRQPTVYGTRLTLLPTGDLRRAVDERVRAAELETQSTCMWCGRPGQYWSDGGWIHVACTEHRMPHATALGH
jgi:hypothetical protein